MRAGERGERLAEMDDAGCGVARACTRASDDKVALLGHEWRGLAETDDAGCGAPTDEMLARRGHAWRVPQMRAGEREKRRAETDDAGCGVARACMKASDEMPGQCGLEGRVL